MHVRDAQVDTGSAFLTLSAFLCKKLLSKPQVLSFGNVAPDIVRVSGVSAKVKGYVVVTLELAGIEVSHTLLVVSNLPYPVLVGTYILQSHQTIVMFCDGLSLELRTSVCSVCLKSRVNPDNDAQSAFAAGIQIASKTLTAVQYQATSKPSAVAESSAVAAAPSLHRRRKHH